MASLRWGSATHPGLARTQNEDNFTADERLFVVADGMGGHLAGEVASELAVTRLLGDLGDDRTLDNLVAAIQAANTDIFDSSNQRPEHAGMGTTITAIAVVADPFDGEVLGVANVGDSRSYVMRHQRLRQVTIDHSFVQELVAEGAISRDEARTHPRRNIVTRALGIEPYVRVDSWTMPLIRGDRFVLCSDGLPDYATDATISECLRAHPDDPTAAAQACVDAANDGGGGDNITVIVVDVLDGDDPPDPTQEFDVIPTWGDDSGPTTGELHIISDPLDDDGTATAEPAAAIGTAADTATDAADLTTTSIEPTGNPELAALVADTGDELKITSDLTDSTPYDGAGDVAAPGRRASKLFRFVLTVGVAAVLTLSFALLAAWARSGYFVAFDGDGDVVVYQGRKDGFLWFSPTAETPGSFSRDELDMMSVALVDTRPEFSSLASAERFVADRLLPLEPEPPATTATTTVTTATTTVITTAVTSTTVAATTTTER